MDIEIVRQRKSEIAKRFGPWTNHNIHLQGDIYTIDKGVSWNRPALRRVIQTISDVSGKPLHELRVMDLGCLEGLYSVELASQGAEVVGIEGREANIEKARFAKEVRSLDNLKFVHDDVRNVSKDRYGDFDVILCLGILYHLDATDVFPFMERMAELCLGFSIIDTHVSLAPEKSYMYKGERYWGSIYREHDASSSPDERARALWASLDNLTSFWLTRPSLLNLLANMGFTSVYECCNPRHLKQGLGRFTLLAMKGSYKALLTTPEGSDEMWAERSRYLSVLTKIFISIGRMLPKNIKRSLQRR